MLIFASDSSVSELQLYFYFNDFFGDFWGKKRTICMGPLYPNHYVKDAPLPNYSGFSNFFLFSTQSILFKFIFIYIKFRLVNNSSQLFLDSLASKLHFTILGHHFPLFKFSVRIASLVFEIVIEESSTRVRVKNCTRSRFIL